MLINNLNKFGITIHYVDNDIDTGDIIAQKMINIKHTDNCSKLLIKPIKNFQN